MKKPTADDVAAAKKIAAAKGVHLYQLEYPSPDVDVCVLALGMNAKDFAGFWDTATRDSDDARDRCYTDHVVWPAAAEADALAESIPALSALVTKDLTEIAGKVDDMSPTEFRLLPETLPAQLERAGISAAKATELRATAMSPLTAVHFPDFEMSREGRGFAVVMKVPSRAVFRAKMATYNAARVACSGIWDAACAAVRDSIVWTSEGESPDAIFDKYPGVPAVDLIYTLQRIGGGTAKGERRRL